MTVANVWPGAEVAVDDDRRFTIRDVDTPYLWLTSPRGIELVAEVTRSLSSGGVTLPDPGRFERTRYPHGAYTIGNEHLYGHAYSLPGNGPFEVAVWTAPRNAEPRDMPQTHAVDELVSVLSAGGDRDAAAFQSAIRCGVTVRWDLRPFPPYTHYYVGGGWHYLPGYWDHRRRTETYGARGEGATALDPLHTPLRR